MRIIRHFSVRHFSVRHFKELAPRRLLKHPREEPKPDDQTSGVDDDRDVDAVPMRILTFFIAL